MAQLTGVLGGARRESLAALRLSPLHPVAAVHLDDGLAAVVPADPWVEVQNPGRRLPVDGLGADELDHELGDHERRLPAPALGDHGVVLGPGGPGAGHDGDVRAHREPAGDVHHPDPVRGELFLVNGDGGGAPRRRRRGRGGVGGGGGRGDAVEVLEVRFGGGERVGRGGVEGGGRGVGPREEEEGREDQEGGARRARGRRDRGGEGRFDGAGGGEGGRERRLQLPAARVLGGQRGRLRRGPGGGGRRRREGEQGELEEEDER
jgi:hypothetical protein